MFILVKDVYITTQRMGGWGREIEIAVRHSLDAYVWNPKQFLLAMYKMLTKVLQCLSARSFH